MPGHFIVIVFAILVFSCSVFAQENAYPPLATPLQSTNLSPPPSTVKEPKAFSEFVLELDPYYSNISLHIPLANKPIPEITGVNELNVYRQLFVNSLIPNFMLIEAAVMPMPLLGVASKTYAPDFYRGFNIGSGKFNLLEAITAGFQEPYAFTIFFGDVVSFVKPGEEKKGTNKGYMGYMASYSNQHIKRNVLIPDHSVEAEWKMKGDRVYKDDKLSWSFRLGAKIHQNPDITNTYYLGFRRNNLDFKADFLSYLHNIDINMRLDFSARNGHLIRQEYILGKKFPIQKWHAALKVEFGIIWEDQAVYGGILQDKDFQSLKAVIRPNIEF